MEDNINEKSSGVNRLLRGFWKSQEISDDADYEAITQITSR
jgi:hypothetical protein